ncbi:LuxR family transcriptional regulator [Streptomyces sp. NBC_01136]|uniref:helix-turn-helix transcriptional regulator n=1 Tax=Streptomyces sp. NBC_01136 TaxID=2903754 RepID=UPI003863C7B5|nr:LuxR family transcriptional regulator [Streptomyces sp. NBC_01136]
MISKPLAGREREFAELRALLDHRDYGDRALVLLGEAGIGKTVLLNALSQHAAGLGFRVLTVVGRAAECDLPLAGLHRLLLPVRVDAGLPADLSEAPGGPQAAEALVPVLTGLSERAPVLLTVDDAGQMDTASLESLAFAAHRLTARRIAMVIAARGPAAPPGFEACFPELRLLRLPYAAAATLLDRIPAVPRGHARERVLAGAEGNPQALVELADAATRDRQAHRHSAVGPLAPTGRLVAETVAKLAHLPPDTLAALLIAAVAEDDDQAPVPADPRALLPAEEIGLVRVDETGLRFTHPLVRPAVYHAAPFTARAAAHRELAGALFERADRRAWHLAAASVRSDEDAAALLEATAGRPGTSDAAARARALQRAADLSTTRHDRARRLVAAAEDARDTGQADWVADLATAALGLADAPGLSTAVREAAGWAQAWTSRQTAAFAALVSVAREAAPDHPALAWRALASAALVAHHTGHPEHRAEVRRRLTRMPEHPCAGTWRSWIRVCVDSFDDAREALTHLHGSSARSTPGLTLDPGLSDGGLSGLEPGAVACLLDESELAVTLLRDAEHGQGTQASREVSPAALATLGRALLDTGRWDQALAVASNAQAHGERYGMDLLTASAALVSATVHALRGDSAAARAAAEQTRGRIDPAESRLVAAEALRALALAADADEEHLVAYLRHRRLLPDGRPLHARVSLLDLADLAAAAVRANEIPDARQLIEGAVGRLTGPPSPRLAQIIARARALLADPGDAEAHFEEGMAISTGDQWPFERAQLMYDYGAWLRRSRRINDAKPYFAAALDTFQQLGAEPWARRVGSELRASGINPSGAAPSPEAITGLSPQQREVVVMAGMGLTNREIADRLVLSPRTVAAHLYRSYPKLGVSRRHQLHGLIGDL